VIYALASDCGRIAARGLHGTDCNLALKCQQTTVNESVDQTMRKLLFLAVLGGVVYGLRKLAEDAPPSFEFDEPGSEYGDESRFDQAAMDDELSEDDRLDEALRESFPASDPPSVSR
jgi:hypothetical protein